MTARGSGLRSRRNNPAKWSTGALELYQRARSSNITIIYADGKTRTVNRWAVAKRRRKASSS